MVTTFIGI